MVSKSTLAILCFFLVAFGLWGTIVLSFDMFYGSDYHVIAYFERGGSLAMNNLPIILLQVILLGIMPIVASSFLLTVAHLKGNLAGIDRLISSIDRRIAGRLTVWVHPSCDG
jgi:hypothetical protein